MSLHVRTNIEKYEKEHTVISPAWYICKHQITVISSKNATTHFLYRLLFDNIPSTAANIHPILFHELDCHTKLLFLKFEATFNF